MNIHNALSILSHCITQLIVVHLYVVEITILILIDLTHKLSFSMNFFCNNFTVSWDHSLSKKDFT